MTVSENRRRQLAFGLTTTTFSGLLEYFPSWWAAKVIVGLCLLPILVWFANVLWRARLRTAGQLYPLVDGVIGGLLAAIAYNIFCQPLLVRGPFSLDVIRHFGRTLLATSNAGSPRANSNFFSAAFSVGMAYHLGISITLCILFLPIMLPIKAKGPFGGLVGKGVLWGAVVEALLVLAAYATSLQSNTVLWGMLIIGCWLIGVSLGVWLLRRWIRPLKVQVKMQASKK